MSKRVLIVEDEPHITEAITFLMERDGWQVLVHSDGHGALEKIIGSALDLVILDAMLPNRSGFDILRDLRRRPGFGKLPVLMLTAKGQARDREEALKAGASLFMTKPFSNQNILANIQKLVP